MAERRTVVRLVVAIVLVAIIVWFVRDQWVALRATLATVRPQWGTLALASGCVVAGYAVLVQAWRALVHAWGDRLGALDATRIWFVSSLGKYVPGKIVAIGAMALLARETGVSAVAATGSAVVMQLANIAAGAALVAAIGTGDLFAAQPALRMVAWSVLAATGVGIAFGPRLLEQAFALAARVSGRSLPTPARIGRGTLAAIVTANVVAWIAYGIGYHLFCRAMLGRPVGSVATSTAVWVASYLVGYLTLVAPGGLGAREVALVALSSTLGLVTPTEGAVLAGGSRLWLTMLEIVPGLVLLPGTAWRRSTSRPSDGPTP